MRTVTLYIDDSSLRLVVVQGKRIKKWAESVLEPGLVKSNVVVEEAEVAARVRQLFNTQKVTQKKIVIGLSGLHCLTRPMVLPILPKAMLEEAVVREAKRVLPVPPEQLYLAWQTLAAVNQKQQVFVVAVPCKTADPLIRTLHRAGLKPYLMEIKPLALARVVKEPTAMLVDVQATDFDIVIMSGGIPQPIRTVPLPAEELGPEDKLQKVKEELERTIQFYNANNPDHVLGSQVPIYMSGELANRPELNKSLSNDFGFPVSTLPSPIQARAMDPTRYIVNMGLALKESSGKDGHVVNVNALPVPYRPKPLPLLKMIAVPSAVAFVGITVLLTTLVQDASASVASNRNKLEQTNALIAQKQATKKELNTVIGALEKNLASLQSSHTAFASALSLLDSQHKRIDGDLLLTTGQLLTSITLISMSQSSSVVAFRGIAPDEFDVLSYARGLEPSGRFSEITVTTIRRLENGMMEFILTLKTKEGGK